MRSVPDWVGKTADTPVPPRVRIRVFERHKGRCHISGWKIQPGDEWDCDHVIALINWSGEGHGNCESNLAPALRGKHREKTAQDVKAKSKVARIRAKHIGAKVKKPWHPTLRKKMNGEVVPR
jgi:5-methylcytosine-specific restriction enzyme A